MNYFRLKASQQPKKIVFPEANVDRILLAVAQIANQKIARPILIGNSDRIEKSAKNLGVELNKIKIVTPAISPQFDHYVNAYCKKRKNVPDKIAQIIMRKPLFFGAMMVAQGEADGIVGGIAHTTSWIIRAASLTIGFEPGISCPSSFFIMIIPELLGEKNKILIFADAAVTIKPTAEQLAEIALLTAKNTRRLLKIEPRIALLSFSTKGSADHEEVRRVIKATGLAREISPDLSVNGELQVDAALIPEIAQKKVKESPVAGQANVLIFPDLNSANIAYKLVQHLGHARAIGPILQGSNKPISDLSRGATVEDIIDVTAVTVVLAQA